MNNGKIGITLNGLGIGDDNPVRIMGILNLSEESFYKASVVDSSEISKQADLMIRNGAAMLDIGGRSTAPHAATITVDEECGRVISALEAFFEGSKEDAALVSIDTQHVKVGERALDVFVKHGKEKTFMINDVSGLNTDKRMASWIAEIRKPLVIMASHSVPGDSIGIRETLDDIARAIDKLLAHGYDTESLLIIDPAVGRWIPGKSHGYDCELVARLSDFRALGKPILAGISRKSFVGAITGAKDPKDRLAGTLSATAIAVYEGAHIIRAHDVTPDTVNAILVASEIRRARL